MNIPISPYTPPLEYHCVWTEAFNEEECQAIIDFAELAEFEKGRVGDGEDASKTDDLRNSSIVWLDPNRDNDWIHRKIHSLVTRINFDKFHMDLIKFDGFQYTKYGVGQHYDWHNDVQENPDEFTSFRKLSVSVCLSDPSSYEGGEFLLCPSGNPKFTASFKPGKGDLLAFYSFVPHKINPVISGERLSLVTWAMGPKFV